MSTTDLAGTTAVMTGATSGIAKATALSVARSGRPRARRWRDAARGDAVVAPIQAKGGNADFVAADLRSVDSARSFARRAIELAATWTSWSTTPPSSPWVRPRKLARRTSTPPPPSTSNLPTERRPGVEPLPHAEKNVRE